MTYTDQMYGVFYNEQALYHHGILGQKWGVRRFQNADGSYTSAGKKRYGGEKAAIGSAARVRQKQAMFAKKIKNTGDDNVIIRNTLNDWRRGRMAQLDTKAKHREARERYLKNPTESNRRLKNAALVDRVVKNGLLSVNTMDRGTYNRYRKSGNDITDAVLKTVGTSMIRNAAVNAVGNSASVAVQLAANRVA